MKTNYLFLLIIISCFVSCQRNTGKEELKKEIFATEQAFEKMASEKGISEAFYYFADEQAVIKRERDTLIIGKENIKVYYQKKKSQATVTWAPDFIHVSDDGTLGYTYGKYTWRIKKANDSIAEFKGIFHTVWKKQQDHTWKYVWD